MEGGGTEAESRLPKRGGGRWLRWSGRWVPPSRGRSFSVLLRVQLPLAAAHSRDEGGALPAAILGEQEVHVAFGRQVLHRLLEDPGEAARWRRTGGVVRQGRGCGKAPSCQLWNQPIKSQFEKCCSTTATPQGCSEIQYVPPNPRSADSLWVEFVKRAVHAHGDVQVVQRSVLSDLVHHGRHPGSADLRGAAGHGAAHLLDDDAVVAGAVEPQLLQDRPDLQQRQTVAEGEGSEVRQQQARHRIPHSCSRRLTWA